MSNPDASPGRNAGPSDPPDPAETGLEALTWAVSTRAAGHVVRELEIRRRRRVRRRLVASAGAGAMLLMLASFWPGPWTRPPASPVITASSRLISPPSRVLPDGSTVELRPGAMIDVRFSPTVRRITLRSGEAHFQVMKDSSRPFVVTAANIEVRAVGTAFNVDLGALTVNVLVTEGQVAVTSNSPAQTAAAATLPPLLVSAGQSTSLPLDEIAPPVVLPVSLAEQGSRLAWRAPLLEFSGTTLAEAIPMFNREAAVKLDLDPRLGSLKLSGKLRANDTETLLTLLRNEFDIVAEPDGRGTIRLFRP